MKYNLRMQLLVLIAATPFTLKASTTIGHSNNLNRTELSENRISNLCKKVAPVLIVDNFAGNPTNEKIIDLNADAEFDTYHGNLVEKIVQLNGQKTIRFNIGSTLTSAELADKLKTVVDEIEQGKLKVSWINFSQGYDRLEFRDFNKLLKSKLKGQKIDEHNIHLYSSQILDELITTRPKLKFKELTELLTRLQQKDVPVIVAAGNNSFRGINLYSLLPNVITVGALDQKGRKAAYSGDNSTVTLWRDGFIKTYAINGGINIGPKGGVNFRVDTPYVPVKLLKKLKDQYVYDHLKQIPVTIDRNNDDNRSVFLDLAARLPKGIYDTRQILRKTLATPFFQVGKIKDLGSFFYIDGTQLKPRFFFDVDSSGNIKFSKEMEREAPQLRNTILGTSFAAPSICNGQLTPKELMEH